MASNLNSMQKLFRKFTTPAHIKLLPKKKHIKSTEINFHEGRIRDEPLF